jgi:hypothetical protein
MRQYCIIIILATLIFNTGLAQMWNGTDTLFGNEWIRDGQSYYQLKIGADGIYRLPYAALQEAGLPVDAIAASRYQLWCLGQEQPLYASAGASPLAPGDFLEFYARKNRGELDRHLFERPDEEMLNPWHSMFTDSAAYFLTWGEPGETGRRYAALPNDLSSPPPAESWFWDTLQLNFSSNVFFKRYDGQNLVAYSVFDEAEGFASPLQQQHTHQLAPAQAFAGGPDGVLRIRLASGAGEHRLEVRLNGLLVHQADNFPPYRLDVIEIPVSNAALQSPIELAVRGFLGNNDRYVIADISLAYPRRYSLTADFLQFGLPPSPARRYFELPNAALGLVYDLGNARRLEAEVQGSTARFALPPLPQPTQLALANASNGIRVLSASALRPVVWEDFQGLTADYLIISHPALWDANEPGNPVQEYAAYRASAAGGGHTAAIVATEQLYLQFGYGLEQHPLALRNFSAYLTRDGQGPRFIFLLGKGYEYNFVRDESSPLRAQNLVPTYGIPGSDNLLFAPPGSSTPRGALGRLAAQSKQEVREYLEKVKAHDASWDLPRNVENFAWKKRVLHLAGAAGSEQNGIVSLLRAMENEIARNNIGAKVTTFRRESTDPVAGSVNSRVIASMDEGVLIKTFMGHGGVVNTDFAIDDPELFNNAPRFPLIFSLGCLTGNVYTPQYSVSEAFTLTGPDQGGIAYISSSGYGLTTSLESLTRRFYALAGGDFYGASIGEIMTQVRAGFDNHPFFGTRALVDQLNLHGDPAIRINDLDAPDYVIDFQSARLVPPLINTLTERLEIGFDLVNIGSTPRDTFLLIEYTHRLPNGQVQVFIDSVLTTGSFTNVQSSIPLPRDGSGVGINSLSIRVDADNRIQELPAPEAEENNTLQGPGGEDRLTFFIFDNTARPLYPPEFAIVDQQDLELIAATADVFAPEADFRFEIDTTARFDSPLKTSTQQRAAGGLVRWASNIQLTEDRVYYWRVGIDSTALGQDSVIWISSSFLYQTGNGPGWNQSHYYQLLDNGYDRLLLGSDRQFRYIRIPYNIIGRAVIRSETNDSRTRVFLNSDRVLNVTTLPSISAVVIDSLTGRLWRAASFNLGNANQRANAINFFRDGIPPGFWVVAITSHSPGQSFALDQWPQDSLNLGDNLASVLRAQGAVLIDQLYEQGASPYIFAYQKDIGPVAEDLALPGEENANIFFDFLAPSPEGGLASRLIGPAQSWGALEWSYRPGHDSLPPPDESKVQVWGLANEQAPPQLLLESYEPPSTRLNAIDAAQYPFLRLQWKTRDSLNRVAPQLDYWRVYYRLAPDLALTPPPVPRQDTIQEGDWLRLPLGVTNLSGQAFDSLAIRYTIIAADNQQTSWTEQVPPLEPWGQAELSLEKETRGFPGLNRLLIELNPERAPLERDYLNNIASRVFYVENDRRPPVLDLTFDGQRIMDGDLVSSRPLIVISLKDENKFLAVDDTALFRIRLRYPSGLERPIFFTEPNLLFQPGRLEKGNRASIEWMPQLEEDGEYQLAVQGRDASGNASGEWDYRIRFEVITQRSISKLLPYPNPFSTATRFVYTLTGDGPPERFMIRIMTVSGRVVRQITQDEFGPLRVGTHLSDFVWDGTDDFGDRLANGVYLYQVLAEEADGSRFDSYENSPVDRFFKGDIGKVVLMR